MHVGLILLPLSPPPSGRKIVSFGSHSSRYCVFGFGTSIHQKCHLIGQKDKELKNLSVGREYGKASQNCKNTSSPLTLSPLLLSLQKRPSVLKSTQYLKALGICHQHPHWKDGLFLLVLAKSWFLALGATSVSGSKSPVNGTINGLSKERGVAEGWDQPNQSMRWNQTTQGPHSPSCLFLPSLPTINLSICSGESSCIKDLLSHPLIKMFHWQRNTFSHCCIFTVWRLLVRTIWGCIFQLCWFQMSGEDTWLITDCYCHEL